MSNELPTLSLQKLHDATAWLLQTGKSPDLPVLLDRRGICYLNVDKHDKPGLGLPPMNEMVSDSAIYLRLVF